jgi:hypothetical protein
MSLSLGAGRAFEVKPSLPATGESRAGLGRELDPINQQRHPDRLAGVRLRGGEAAPRRCRRRVKARSRLEAMMKSHAGVRFQRFRMTCCNRTRCAPAELPGAIRGFSPCRPDSMPRSGFRTSCELPVAGLPTLAWNHRPPLPDSWMQVFNQDDRRSALTTGTS